MKKKLLFTITFVTLMFAFAIIYIFYINNPVQKTDDDGKDSAVLESPPTILEFEPEEGEIHLSTLRRLTNGGENAEAYFNQAGDKLIFQSTRDGNSCDQIYMMNLDGSGLTLVSKELGRNTCSFIVGQDDFLIYSSTHHLGSECPEMEITYEGGYAWLLYNYDVYRRDMDGSNLVNLTNSDSYDAEAISSPDGSEIVFSSTRDGDQEIYIMNADGSNLRRLTNAVGYDGGPFFSWDGSKIVFRSHRPQSEEEAADYKEAVAAGIMKKVPLEIYVMDRDGANMRQVTNLGRASFAPFMHPDGKRIIFCSNYGPKPWVFNLFVINVDGTGLEQITFNDAFDGFPMFSKDGKKLVFCSNRHTEKEGETNVFITDWVDPS